MTDTPKTLAIETEPFSRRFCDGVQRVNVHRPLSISHTGTVTPQSEFEKLLDDANKVSTVGWDFSWFEGRATEERPTWGYSRSLVPRIEHSRSTLDLQTGGGERLAEVLAKAKRRPRIIVATESWPPNAALAKVRLAPYNASIVEQDDEAPLPFPDNAFDLVCARHPTTTVWSEIGRVLQNGGSFFSQQIGSRTNQELAEFMVGTQPISETQNAQHAATLARLAGLEVTDLREESLPVVFYDIGAVIYFLRKVVWTVPDFSVDKYHDRLLAMYEHIEQYGSFESKARRFLIEAKKP